MTIQIEASPSAGAAGPFSTIQRYRRLLSGYLWPHWRRALVLLAVLIATIGVQIATPLVAARFIDQALGGAALEDLLWLAVLAIALAVIHQAFAIAETYVAEHISWAATNALRADLLAHLLRLDATFHNAHTPGELIERTDGDVATLARFFSRFIVSILGNGVLILGVLALLWAVDWRVGAGLGAFVSVALAVMLRIRALATPSWAAERQATADFYGFVGEYVSGLEDVRSNGAAGFVMRRCAEVMRAWLRAVRTAQMWGYALVASSHGLFALGTTAAFAISAVLFRNGELTIGTCYLIFRYAEMLRQPTEQIRNEIADLQQAGASIVRIEELLGSTPRLEPAGAARLPTGPLAVSFEHVSFEYQAGTPVLRDVQACVAAGRVLGVVGRTGSGKTTLTRLAARLFDPQQGVVRLGGVDVRALALTDVRARIGLVTQDVHLFAASVRDNLTLFDPQISTDRLNEALETLGLAAWVERLPHGLDTLLGAGGVDLSAGQAQLLACARILLRDPDVVILDEPSSRLDPATEQLVHDAFGRLLKGRTGMIVAHRLSTVAYADDILVLEDGAVLEHGPRCELKADPSSHFAALLRVAAEEIV